MGRYREVIHQVIIRRIPGKLKHRETRPEHVTVIMDGAWSVVCLLRDQIIK